MHKLVPSRSLCEPDSRSSPPQSQSATRKSGQLGMLSVICGDMIWPKAHQGSTKQVTISGSTQPSVVLAMLAR
jgi:hypothetical protein